METFIAGLNTVVPNEWKVILGVVALLVVVVPRLLEFRQSFLDVRMGRRQLELEKLRLEVLKLRMDVQQLAKQQSPEVTRELEAITVSPPPVVTASPSAPEHRRGLRGLLARHPRLGRPMMLITQFFLAYLMTIFAVAMVAIPVTGWTDPEFGPGLSLVLAVVYATLAWLSYKGFAGIRSIRKEPAAR